MTKENSKDSAVLKILSHPKYLRTVRVLTGEMGELHGMKGKELDNIKLAVDEACSNVIKHAYRKETGREIVVTFNLSPGEFEVVIEDDGEKVPLEQIKGRDLDDVRPGGLGMHFIRRAFDIVSFDEDRDKGNRLRLVKHSGKRTRA